MSSAAAIVQKSQFAATCGVSKARVSQWISAGAISGAALVGEGRGARIDVAIATEQLRQRLDPSQRFGLNGLTTRLDQSVALAPSAPAPMPAPAAFAAPPVDTVETQLKAEKLRQAQLATRRAEEADRLQRGIYILARDAGDENRRIAAKMFEAFDGALTDFASAIAAKWEIPARDVVHLLRHEMRAVRTRVAKEFEDLAQAEPAEIADVASHDDPAQDDLGQAHLEQASF